MEQNKGILNGAEFNMNEQQKELMDKYISNHYKLLSVKEIIMVEEKLLNTAIAKYSQYKAYVGDLSGAALEKAKKIGLDYMKNDYDGIKQELFVDLMRYSINMNELARLEKIEAELNIEMEKAFGDIVTTIFATTYIDGFKYDINRHHEMDEKFIKKMNEEFGNTGKINEMLLNNCSLESITLEAMNYLVNAIRA